MSDSLYGSLRNNESLPSVILLIESCLNIVYIEKKNASLFIRYLQVSLKWRRNRHLSVSTLTLLVLLIGLAVDIDSALASNHVTVATELLDGSSDFETSS